MEEKKQPKMESEFYDAIEIIKLNKAKMKEVAGRKNATKIGAGIIAVPIILNALFFGLSFGGAFYVYQSIISIASIVVSIFLISLVAVKFFKGKGKHEEFFRVISYGFLLNWVTVIASLLLFLNFWSFLSLFNLVSLVVIIWQLVITYYALIEVHQINSTNSVISIILGVIGGLIVEGILMQFTPIRLSLHNPSFEKEIEKTFENWEQYMR